MKKLCLHTGATRATATLLFLDGKIAVDFGSHGLIDRQLAMDGDRPTNTLDELREVRKP